MLVLLAAYGVLALVLPAFTRWLGARSFWLPALLLFGGFVHAAAQTPAVLADAGPRESFLWIESLGIQLSMRMDTLSWLMTLIVTGVGALIMVYCRWYFEGKGDGLGQFSAVLLAFAAAMYGLVLTDDIVMLVMFWELTSVLSYLLIGHYHRRVASRRAALQALLVTTLGGLVMFVGVVLIVVEAATSQLSVILDLMPTGPVIDIALVLLLVGAVSKSALFPFHFWLPGAMAAPTPVSAYLHAAAMVKAGIYLLARFAPVYAEEGVWRPIVVSIGVFTMLLGGFQALRERDLKRILAFGTVSQLGFIAVVIGFGGRDAALAGIALLLGHALFKSALFLIVGIIDRQVGTRDIVELSGVGRRAPALATAAFVSIASMCGIPPMLVFVAKEAAFTALLDEAFSGDVWGWIALVGVAVGSALTFGYGLRFLWGAFWTKRGADGAPAADCTWKQPSFGFIVAPLLLALLSIAGGAAVSVLDPALATYADTAPGADDYHLALWHGLEPALWISAGTLVVGALLFWGSRAVADAGAKRLLPFTAADAYYLVARSVDQLSVAVTTLTQRGSLPVYIGTVFLVLGASEGTALAAGREWRVALDAWQHPAQLAVAPLMIAAGIIAVRARKRYTGVVLVSVTGIGMIVLFGSMGAPDLALTQVLVEAVTLIAFALVLRRLPSRMGAHHGSVAPVLRAVLATAVGVTMAVVVTVATGARVHDPVSVDWETAAYEIGHGHNIVNVALVDIRGWDTMGELSVLVLAATGVASLVFVTQRSSRILDRIRHAVPGKTRKHVRRAARRASRRPLVETTEGIAVQTPQTRHRPRAWLLGGRLLGSASRSLILEVVVRVLFHSIIVVSLYLLFAGHNLPGGGFAAGLVAGMALVMRYVAGGRFELGVAAPRDAGQLLGAGMIVAVGTAIAPIAFGLDPLTRAVWEADLPVVGHIEFVTSTIFDIGVYLVVIGLVLDVLRSLGAEVDRQLRGDEEPWRSSIPEGVSGP